MVAMPDETIPPRFNPEEPEWFDELDDMIESGEEVIVYPPAAAGWEITSTVQAENVMRRLRRLEARKRETKEQAQTWREPIDEWEADQLKRCEPGIAFFTQQLREFGIRHRREWPKEPTIRLPSGEIGTRVGKAPTVDVVDERAVIAWIDAYIDGPTDEVVKTERSVKLTPFRAIVEPRRLPTPWCVQCGGQLVEQIHEIDGSSSWTHLEAEIGEDHRAEPVMEWAVVYLDNDDVPLQVQGVAVRQPEITATPKPKR